MKKTIILTFSLLLLLSSVFATITAQIGTTSASYTETDPFYFSNPSGYITSQADTSGLVPYTGATTHLDLGFYDILANKYKLQDDTTFGFTGLRDMNVLPLLVGEYSDLLMFTPIYKLEVWYNESVGWVDETASNTLALKYLTDGKPGTSLNFYHDWQKIRLSYVLPSGWTYDRGGMWQIDFLQDGSNAIIPNYDLQIEMAKDTAFTNTYEAYNYSTFINQWFEQGFFSQPGEAYEHRFLNNLENSNSGRRYIRITMDFNITENEVNPNWEYGSGNEQAAKLDNIKMLHSRLDRGQYRGLPYYWNEEGYIGIKDSTPDYPLDVVGESGGISIYAEYDISALDVIDRTQVNTGDALSVFQDGSTLLDETGEIDHSLFPECVKTWVTQEAVYDEDPETEFNGILYYEDVNNSGWSTSCEKALYRQALSQINDAVDIVKTTEGTLLDAEIISAETIYTESKVPQPNINYMDKFDINVIDKKATHYAIELDVEGKDRLNMEDRIVSLEGAVAQLSTELCSVSKKYTWCGK